MLTGDVTTRHESRTTHERREKAPTMTSPAYVRPPCAARVISSRMARLFLASSVCRLSVRGRTTGRWRSLSVAVLEHDGQRYLLAASGDSEDSRNLRGAGGGRPTRHGRVEEVTTAGVSAQPRPALIEADLRGFGKLPTVARTCRALRAPGDHAIFRSTRIYEHEDLR
jgi:hypothetical protein